MNLSNILKSMTPEEKTKLSSKMNKIALDNQKRIREIKRREAIERRKREARIAELIASIRNTAPKTKGENTVKNNNKTNPTNSNNSTPGSRQQTTTSQNKMSANERFRKEHPEIFYETKRLKKTDNNNHSDKQPTTGSSIPINRPQSSLANKSSSMSRPVNGRQSNRSPILTSKTNTSQPVFQQIQKVNSFESDSFRENEFFSAINNRDLPLVESSLTGGIGLQQKTINQLICNAIRENDLQLLKIFLKNPDFVGIINNSKSFDENPLFLTLRAKKRVSILKLFVENGVNINQTNKNGKTLLEQAIAEKATIRTISFLTRNSEPITPYTLSLAKDNTRISGMLARHMKSINYKDLVDYGIDANIFLQRLCISKNNDKIVEIYKQNEFSRNDQINLLCTACRYRNKEIFDFLIKKNKLKPTLQDINNILLTILRNDINIDIEMFNRLSSMLSPKNKQLVCNKLNIKNLNIHKNNQVSLVRTLKYENGELKIKDIAFNCDGKKQETKNIFYEIEYDEKGKKTIEYHKIDGTKSITVTIDKNNTISFDKNKMTDKEINDYPIQISDKTYYDSVLSYTNYNLNNNVMTHIENTDISDISNAVVNSLNDETVHCYDLSIDGHNMQVLIYNGMAVVLNTWGNFRYITEEIEEAAINIAVNRGIPDNQINRISVCESKYVEQKHINCRKVSKQFLNILIQKVGDLKKFIRYESRKNELLKVQKSITKSRTNPTKQVHLIENTTNQICPMKTKQQHPAPKAYDGESKGNDSNTQTQMKKDPEDNKKVINNTETNINKNTTKTDTEQIKKEIEELQDVKNKIGDAVDYATNLTTSFIMTKEQRKTLNMSGK